jgi:hypothetical protein
MIVPVTEFSPGARIYQAGGWEAVGPRDASGAVANLFGAAVLGAIAAEIVADLSRPIAEQLREDAERCERWRAQAGAVVVC